MRTNSEYSTGTTQVYQAQYWLLLWQTALAHLFHTNQHKLLQSFKCPLLAKNGLQSACQTSSAFLPSTDNPNNKVCFRGVKRTWIG